MKKEMDKIQFEYRYEVQELMKVIDKYVLILFERLCISYY